MRIFRRFKSPLQRVAQLHQPLNKIESIHPFSIAPWHKRIGATIQPQRQEAAQMAAAAQGILVATSASEKKGIVRAGGVICDTTTTRPPDKPTMATYTVTLGSRDRFNIYFAETIAVATALQNLSTLPSPLENRAITVLSSNLSLVQVISNPTQQSGQSYICQIYTATQRLAEAGNLVSAIWTPAHEHIYIMDKAKATARQAANLSTKVNNRTPSAKATVLSLAKQELQLKPIEKVGEYTRKFDTAFPGKHTSCLYNAFKRTEAEILAQLRTGMSRLNGYLYRIKAVDSDLCVCGQAKETVEHFLFRCTQWNEHRKTMLRHAPTRSGSLSFFLGGKAASDPTSWKPSLPAVRATVQYAIATGRLAIDTT